MCGACGCIVGGAHSARYEPSCPVMPVIIATRPLVSSEGFWRLWEDIRRRLEASAPRGKESKDNFKKRLRRTALATPPGRVRAALENMKKRAAAVYEAKGGDIALD